MGGVAPPHGLTIVLLGVNGLGHQHRLIFFLVSFCQFDPFSERWNNNVVPLSGGRHGTRAARPYIRGQPASTFRGLHIELTTEISSFSHVRTLHPSLHLADIHQFVPAHIAGVSKASKDDETLTQCVDVDAPQFQV